MSRPQPLLVRRTDVDKGGRHAGSFRDRAKLTGILPAFAVRALGILCFDTREPVFVLTYDDGPDPEHTPGVLDALRRHRATATFFVMTDRARRHPDLVARMVREGHEVQLHGRDHSSLLRRSSRRVWRELGAGRSALATQDVAVTLYRPPYLEFSAVQAVVIAARGLQLSLASGDGADWDHDTVENIAARAVRSVFPGAVLLMHDGRADPETAPSSEALPRFSRAEVADRLLAEVAARGLRAESWASLARRARPVCARSHRRRTP